MSRVHGGQALQRMPDLGRPFTVVALSMRRTIRRRLLEYVALTDGGRWQWL